jgi:hypothetical protein
MTTKAFTATVSDGGRGTAYIALPFDPDGVWGRRTNHQLHGTVGGRRFRGSFTRVDDEWRTSLGPVWRRDNHTEIGDSVKLVLEPEGPQRTDLDADIVEALDASSAAALQFDGLAQFYRKAFLKWIDGTKRRPDERARRIAEMITLLEAGKKSRD